MLIKCPECDLHVSDKALSCPHCGYPMKEESKPRLKRKTKRRRLPNGFGQISEIKGRNLRKPFRAMVTVGKTETGRPICKPLKPESYFETYNDAYAALVEYNRNPYDLAPAITMTELYEKWMEEYKTKVAESSWKALENAWLYCSEVYTMRAKDLRARHVKKCMEEGTAMIRGKEQGTTASMQAKLKSLFNLMLDYALEYEIVDKNYARTFNLSNETIESIKDRKKEHIPFTDEEIDKLWNSVDELGYVAEILIQCYSGWRPQELSTIRLENVNLEEWTFEGGMKTEAGKDRIVPIHPRIRPLVERKYKEAQELGSEYLLNVREKFAKHKTDTRLTYTRYMKGFSLAVEVLGLNPDHRPHDGRKHFVTKAKKYKMDEYAIKYIIGHAIQDLTERVYTERELEWLHEEIKKIK